jgi:signal transduction histidine kinase
MRRVMGKDVLKVAKLPALGELPGLDAEPMDRARVLVIDDDEHNLLAIRTVIEEIADVVVANSGEQALRCLLKDEFAVILLDVYMPGMDGYETARLIRSREQTKRIPIVFLSAVNKETEHLMRGYSMGAVDYVFKPVDPLILRSKVNVFVDLYTMRREVQRKALQEQALMDAALRANAERLHVEQELRRSEQRQAAIISSLPIVLYLEPAQASPRVPQFVAGNFTALTGFSLPDLETSPSLWEERLHPEDRDRALAALAERLQTGVLATEYRWLCADGEYKHFLDQAVFLPGTDGNADHFAGTLLDVTDQRNLETQLVHARKMDAIGKLTGGIAHDFNNLLAVVLGGIGLIERRVSLDEEQRRLLTMARHAAEQGSELINRLLAFARRQKLEPGRIEVGRLASTVRELLAHTLGGLVRLEWERDDSLWCVYADGTQLELALMNLIINARDAMPDGGLITVSGRNSTLKRDNGLNLPKGDYVVLSVRDDGCGIAPEILEQVMEPFFTTKEVGKGTGLGLSMVYGFAEQSGGGMRIDSKVGEGTCVEIWLPRAPEAAELAAGPRLSNSSDDRSLRPLRILLADDHAGVRATTAALLQDLGHEVIEVEDGAALLSHMERVPDGYDLIVSDYAMPLVSGTDVINGARSLCANLPCILITGYADTQSIANRPDNVQVLSKPFTPQQLVDAIRDATCEDRRVAAE